MAELADEDQAALQDVGGREDAVPTTSGPMLSRCLADRPGLSCPASKGLLDRRVLDGRQVQGGPDRDLGDPEALEMLENREVGVILEDQAVEMEIELVGAMECL